MSLDDYAVSPENAQEFTEALGQILAGAVRMTDVAQDLGIPQALGLTPQQWTEKRLAVQVRLSIPERRVVVAELTERGMSTREIGDVLGVDQKTVVNDRHAEEKSSDPKRDTAQQAESEPDAEEHSSPDPEPEPDEEDAVSPLTRSQLSNQQGGTDEWATPQDFYDAVDAEFGFELDVCALDSSAKCERYFTPETDGLAQDWTGTVWMNPPYGDAIGGWVLKAWESAQAGATVACLLPARVDTGWWWDYCRYGEVRFLRGRLRFGESTTSAPFPSVLVIFGPGRDACVKWWEWR
jgi:phage N-6-adenine-methyltransferase